MYQIKEFAAMTGLPPSKVRFYERCGLLEDKRNESGYRVFAPEDAFRVNSFRMLLQYGFTVESAVRLVDENQATDAFADELRSQRARLQREADLLSYRLARIDGALELMEDDRIGDYAIVDMPNQLYVNASHGRDFSVSAVNARAIAFFYALLSVTSCARIISRGDLESDSDVIDPSYVISLPETEAHRLEGCPLDQVKRLELGKCVRVRRRLTRAESLRKESFAGLRSYLCDRGFRLRGDVILLPAFLNLDGCGIDAETVFAPVV